ncbi:MULTISPECIES: aldo/keto reductase [unclassified Saccharopolyspora]|uniref:aldo/keto reductase n=1 Tax=unclassified Saccharopolyspora TaxID=2646250 RepID=UPI001CD38B27|nr:MULTISPECIES: aldo/keto reductase [unclassified Saccharopolyspora]MCA1186499.1 aldo/keto reductase [Saccharopolyspora sp. 6T]MCA1194878.1 aldo/keto reductase [Saccharopolyspora sp. 6V]MCA1227130.1 aldo/keto reductase [Saccharopolyspora sp. 6M]MCA1282169.1 aldo/keto reductase [Saccharopolyspora sp. 7B]
MTQVPNLTLNTGAEIPQLGFGVFQVPPDEVIEPVATAIEAGYRSIDTAAAYGNEEGVGKAIADSGVRREDLFVTTKLWNDQQGYDSTLKAFDDSLTKLGLDYVDLYLIHWPAAGQDKYVDTWRAFEKLHGEGRAKSIGVSNFQIPHLRRLFEETDVVPALNQIELHPNLQQGDLRAFHREHGILTEAWSPIGQGKGLLDDPTLGSLAEKYGKSPAQIVLRWHVQLGNVVIPKSATPSRIRENIQVFDFELADDDLAVIAGLDTGTRVGPDPDAFGA